jgi:prepilin-type N-terminal cleavage/methylation domain-containing protein
LLGLDEPQPLRHDRERGLGNDDGNREYDQLHLPPELPVTRALLRHLRREDGFTLSEMLSAMAVLGLLFAAFATVVGSAVRNGGEIEGQTAIQGEARAAVDRFASELRQVYSGDETTYPIESISATQVTFLSPDRANPFHLRRISYRLNAGSLERAFATSSDTDGYPWTIGSLGAWQKLVGPVRNATVFTYYDATGAVTSTASAVKTVGITLVVSTVGSSSRQFTYTSSVTVRADA